MQLKLYATWQNPNPRVDDAYQAKAASHRNLRDGIYQDPFFAVDIPALLYCFQFLFPLLTLIFVLIFIPLVYNGYLSESIKGYAKEHAEDDESWATAFAYGVLCFIFIIYVFILDVVALALRDRDVEQTTYFKEGNAIHDNLFRYPGTVFLFDLVALLWIVGIIVVFGVVEMKEKTKENEEDILESHKKQFFTLILAGVAPLLCLANHTHYILIAWITDPIYASRIGMYYSITVFVHFFLLKQTYKGAAGCVKSYKTEDTKKTAQYCKLLLALGMLLAFLIIAALQILFTLFYIHIPINHSIRDIPNAVYTIIQGVNALLLAFIAYKVTMDPRSPRSFSISDGVKIALKKWKDTEVKLLKEENQEAPKWDALGDEDKLAEVLYQLYSKLGAGRCVQHETR